MAFNLPGHTLPGPNQKGSPNKIWATLIIGAVKAGAKAYMSYKQKKQDEKVAAIQSEKNKMDAFAGVGKSKGGSSNYSSFVGGNIPGGGGGNIMPVPTDKIT